MYDFDEWYLPATSHDCLTRSRFSTRHWPVMTFHRRPFDTVHHRIGYSKPYMYVRSQFIDHMARLRRRFNAQLSKCQEHSSSMFRLNLRTSIYFSRMHSPIGLNTQLCCERYSFSLYRFSCINRELIGCSVFRDLSNYRSTAGIIYELILAKSGLGVISSLCVTDIDCIIDYLCVS